MIEKENQIVESVIASYQQAIRNRFVKPRVAVGGKTWNNALAFFQLPQVTGHTLPDVMHAAVKGFSKEWLKETLNAKYPPFPMVVCESTRKRVARGFKPRARSTPEQLMKQAREIAATLATTMGTRALEMAQTWPNDAELRKLVQKFLKEKSNV
jgi:hypothetical protein